MKFGGIFNESTFAIVVGAGVIMSGVFANGVVAKADVNPQLQQQRLQVLAAAQKGAAGLPTLIAAMKSPNVIIRCAAVRSMGEIGAPADSALAAALKSDADPLVRRTALRALTQTASTGNLAVLETAMNDNSDLVRAAAVQAIADSRPYTPQITALLKKAQGDPSSDVSQIASEALWPFHKIGVSLRDIPANKDRPLTVVQNIPLPLDGWKFQLDPGQTGQEHNWFGTDFSDAEWQSIKIGEVWETQIGKDYDGVAWYRRSFVLPEKPVQVGTDIVFEAVDESAWVWINGEYVGVHDIGPDGWDKRFAMDISDYVNWGAENQITVRVLDRKFAGGIWKPVSLEVLKQ
jgi:hypothetical protein